MAAAHHLQPKMSINMDAVKYLRQTQFYTSIGQTRQLTDDSQSEIAILGRSNSGKSSLINTLCDQKSLAKTSSRPGSTQLINYFKIKNEHFLVDFPGYGYAKVDAKQQMNISHLMSDYFSAGRPLKGIIICMDARHPLKAIDLEVIHWEQTTWIPKCLVLTKVDKLSRNEQNSVNRRVSNYFQETDDTSTILFSSHTKQGKETLAEQILTWLNDNAN